MADEPDNGVVDSLVLRFEGEDGEGNPIQELRASHVAEVLQGLVGLTSDFDKAGVFHKEGPSGSEVLVRPAKEGSFIIEVVRFVADNHEVIAAGGIPSIGTIIWWATKSARAGVEDFTYLENGNVKVQWQDKTSEEVPKAAWDELQKRTPRRKKQLRGIMAPLSDKRIRTLDVKSPDLPEAEADEGTPEVFVLTRDDYNAVKPRDEVEESFEVFEVEARMAAVDFEDPAKWKVKTKERPKGRNAEMDDQGFLRKVASGLAIRKTDIFRLKVREDMEKKNGRKSTKWTILSVESHRQVANESNTAE